jgi:Na+/H+ antiporter NhaD/arsenite permease-like protein
LAEPVTSLTGHWIGVTALAIFTLAYLLVMLEEKTHLKKSKPVIVAAGLIWGLIGLAYVELGDLATAGTALRHSLGEFAELFLFVLVAMTYVNTMEERQVFDSLRAFLVRKRLSLPQVFWATGALAFVLSPALDNLTTSLVMGTVAVTVGRGHPRFIALACINVVIAANAGGAFSPFGDITTLMVWQAGRASFWDFLRLFVPSVVNWVVPAFFMSLAVPRGQPAVVGETLTIRRGGLVVIALFAVTIVLAVSSYNVLKLPPVLGMTTGLGLLQLYAYYLQRSRPSPAASPAEELAVPLDLSPPTDSAPGGIHGTTPQPGTSEYHGEFDIFDILRRVEWDTLMFFYGIILCVGGLAQIGYLAGLSDFLYGSYGPTVANIVLGLISSVVDNIPVMYAVLSMNPAMDLGQWLLVTLTAGVGGSLLSIGSAAGVALMGQSRGVYTFGSHLRWTWAVALGYAASIAVHLLLNR